MSDSILNNELNYINEGLKHLEGELKKDFVNIFALDDSVLIYDEILEKIDITIEDEGIIKNIFDALIDYYFDKNLSEEIPSYFRELLVLQLDGVTSNELELSIRSSLLISIFSTLVCKKKINKSNINLAIYSFGLAHRYSGISDGLSRAQQMEWRKVEKGAQKRWDNDAKSLAKKSVKECWDNWRNNQAQYRSKSAFARDMLDKFEVLGSQRVIERWCKEWENELSQQGT